MSSKVIQYDNYTITLSINGDEIYMKILDTINFTTYESSFDSYDLHLSNKLLQIYTMIVKTFEEEDGFNVSIIVENSGIKLMFNILLHSFYDINFVIVLKQKIISCDQELTLNLNKLDEKINMLLDRINKLEKENKFYIKCFSHGDVNLGLTKENNSYNANHSANHNYYNFTVRFNAKDLHIDCSRFNNIICNYLCKNVLDLSNVKYLYQLETLFFDNIHSQYVDKQKLIEELESDTLISITFNNGIPLRGVPNNVDYLECMKKCPNIRKLTITNATSYTPLIIETLSSYNNKIDEITIQNCNKINTCGLQNFCLVNKIKLNIL